MTYEEAVGILTAETKKEHEPRCFEVGECDIEDEIDLALVNIKREAQARREQAIEASKVIRAHVRRYDAEQIVPAQEG